jgi:hypothetical protein
VATTGDAQTTAPFTDYEARKTVAVSLLAICKPERYVYLFFSALAGAGILVALTYIFITKTPTLEEVGVLSSSGGVIALTSSRILKIQHDVFRIVFGINL